jgi:hypothetical protein
MCTTPTPRPHTAVISALGSFAVDLPARSSNVEIKGTCTPKATEPLHIVGAGPHMHRLGRSASTDILRGGSEQNRVSVVNVPDWNFDLQQTHPVDLIVNPGDKLVTTCHFDNPTDRNVTFGERTEDEMCLDFLFAWPAPGVVNEGGAEQGTCMDP